MQETTNPQRGDIWEMQLAAVKGGSIPALVVSDDRLNVIGLAPLIVVPLFPNTMPGAPMRVKVSGTHLSLGKYAWAACDQIRAVDRQELTKKLGRASATSIADVERAIATILAIRPSTRARGWAN